jgi:hypothetical protein
MRASVHLPEILQGFPSEFIADLTTEGVSSCQNLFAFELLKLESCLCCSRVGSSGETWQTERDCGCHWCVE